MKKLIYNLLVAICFLASANGQTTILFEDNFDSYEDFIYENVGDWVIVNKNSSGTYGFSGLTYPNAGGSHAFIVFNSTAINGYVASGSSDWTSFSGEKAMVSVSDDNGPNDSWLISPLITLGDEQNLVSFMSKAGDNDYKDEKFNVYVSYGSTNPDAFYLIASETLTLGMDWKLYGYSLAGYENENVRIAIQCVSDDQFGFFVDNFSVKGVLTASIDEYITSQFKIYPNPATSMLTINNGSDLAINEVEIVNTLGEVVKNESVNSIHAQIDVQSLTRGVYFLNIKTESGKVIKKFLKK